MYATIFTRSRPIAVDASPLPGPAGCSLSLDFNDLNDCLSIFGTFDELEAMLAAAQAKVAAARVAPARDYAVCEVVEEPETPLLAQLTAAVAHEAAKAAETSH